MMNDMSLKARLKNMARERNISAQSVLQIYLMNRFLFRLSKSEYKDKFIVKGGMLISSFLGIDHRSTMDIDTTVRNLLLDEKTLEKALNDICAMHPDEISFSLEKISSIRDDDEYGGYRASFIAEFGKMKVPMSMDVTTGDIITPGAEHHTFMDILDGTDSFELWSYTLETVIAEKLETILSRGIDNTRPRDFYDVYMLTSQQFDICILRKAFVATSEHRESRLKIADYKGILIKILSDEAMNDRWISYARQMPYAEGICFDTIIEKIITVFDSISENDAQ